MLLVPISHNIPFRNHEENIYSILVQTIVASMSEHFLSDDKQGESDFFKTMQTGLLWQSVCIHGFVVFTIDVCFYCFVRFGTKCDY